MRKSPLDEHIIGKADDALQLQAMHLWCVPYEVRLLQQASALQIARKLHLRPQKIGKGEYEITVNYMGRVLTGILDSRTNSWQIEPEGDEVSTTLSCFVYGPIQLASIGLQQDFLGIEAACRFIWKNFPHCRA